MKDDVAIVTGGAKGIGRAVALALANRGMQVVVNYRSSDDDAQKCVAEINKVTSGLAVKADITREEDVENMRSSVLNKFGSIDVLVNNAGDIPRPADWESISHHDWQRTLEVNLWGAFNCIRRLAPSMVRQGRIARIVNIVSTYGIMGAAPVVAYTAAKAGLENLTKSFAKELAPSVTVNAVAPGHVDTDMLRSAGDDFVQYIVKETPMKRIGSVHDIAESVVFLCSPGAEFITGHTLVVDGGHLLR